MKKLFIIVLSVFTLVLASCDQTPPIVDEPIEIKNEVELLNDRHFETGFNLLGVSPVKDGREVKKWLDYGGEAKTRGDNPWYMAQWWTPFNVVDAAFSKVEGKYVYQTESRTIKVDPSDKGYLYFDLLTSKEYLNGPRKLGESWTHLLIEQNFNKAVKMDELAALYVSLEITIHRVDDKMGEDFKPDLHAAQLLWYLTLRNKVEKDSNPDEVGAANDFIWFGVPIYDNRFDYVPRSAHIDQGGEGTTGKLIYSMSSKNYFNEPIQMGKTYTIKLDILPHVKDAFMYAVTNNVMKNAQFSNIEIDYMNFGWEVPGSYDVSSTIRDMSILAILKDGETK